LYITKSTKVCRKYFDESFIVMSEKILKTGYVKVLDRAGRIAGLYSIEELYLQKKKRQQCAFDASMVSGRVFCCCKELSKNEVWISGNGEMDLGDGENHTQECAEYYGALSRYVNSLGFGAYIREESLRTDFDWTGKGRASVKLLDEEKLLEMGRTISFDSWLFINNTLAFSRMQRKAFVLDNAMAFSEKFTEQIGDQTFRRVSGGNERSVSTRGNFLYRDRMQANEYGLYYGKIIDIPEKYNSGKGKNVYLRVTQMMVNGTPVGDRDVFLRVQKEQFLDSYNRVAKTEGAYICGFVRIKELNLDSAEKKMGVAVNAGKVSLKVSSEKAGNKKLVKEMKFGRVFCCNSAGLIVFTEKEYELSQRAIFEKLLVYRPVYGPFDYNITPLMVVTKNGKDIRLEDYYANRD